MNPSTIYSLYQGGKTLAEMFGAFTNNQANTGTNSPSSTPIQLPGVYNNYNSPFGSTAVTTQAVVPVIQNAQNTYSRYGVNDVLASTAKEAVRLGLKPIDPTGLGTTAAFSAYNYLQNRQAPTTGGFIDKNGNSWASQALVDQANAGITQQAATQAPQVQQQAGAGLVYNAPSTTGAASTAGTTTTTQSASQMGQVQNQQIPTTQTTQPSPVAQTQNLTTSLGNLNFQGWSNPYNTDIQVDTTYQDTINKLQVGLDDIERQNIENIRNITQNTISAFKQVNYQNNQFLDRYNQATGLSRYTPTQAFSNYQAELDNFTTKVNQANLNENKLITDAKKATLKEKIAIADKLEENRREKLQDAYTFRQKNLDFQKQLQDYQINAIQPYLEGISSSLKGKSPEEQAQIITGYATNIGVSPEIIKSQVITSENKRASTYSGLVQSLISKYPDAQIPAEAIYNNDISTVMNAIRNSSNLYAQSVQAGSLENAAALEKLAPGTYASAQQIANTRIQPTDIQSIELLKQALVGSETAGSKDRFGNLPGSPNYNQYQVVGLTIPSGSNAGFQALGKFQIMPNIWFKKLGGQYAKYNSTSRNAGINKQLEEQFLNDPQAQERLATIINQENLAATGGNVAQAISRYLGTGKVDLATGITNDAYTSKTFNKFLQLIGQTPSGTATAASGDLLSQVANLKLTDSQSKALNFGQRAINADKALRERLQTYDPTTIFSAAGRLLETDNAKAFKRDMGDFITAVLRKESGATITEDEFDRFIPLYSPQGILTNKADIEQTNLKREAAINGLISEAGPAAQILTQYKAGNQPTTTTAPTADLLSLRGKYNY